MCQNCVERGRAKGPVAQHPRAPALQQPRPQVTPPVKSHLHPHPLVDSNHASDWICDSCDEDYKWGDKRYRCDPCDYDLCSSCVKSRPPPPTSSAAPPKVCLQIYYLSDCLQEEKPSDAALTCSICFDAPQNVALVHNSTGSAHVAVCITCANYLAQNNKPCPICNMKIDSIIKLFFS